MTYVVVGIDPIKLGREVTLALREARQLKRGEGEGLPDQILNVLSLGPITTSTKLLARDVESVRNRFNIVEVARNK